jgi:uncharacterized protein DUF4257
LAFDEKGVANNKELDSSNNLKWGERNWQSELTLVMLLVAIATAVIFRTNVLIVAISVAAVGGFLHEIVQSGGSVAYPQQKQDGFYLGSISGLVLGAIAGLLAVQTIDPSAQVTTTFVSQMFFAGLALKGVAEAAGGATSGQGGGQSGGGGGGATGGAAEGKSGSP